MNTTIRDFRKVLRNFEREIAIQNNNCCNTGVSLVQCHLLLDIEKRKSVSITELAQIQSLDKSTISRTVDTLFNKGLINREINPESRRQSIVSLTDNGRKACTGINETNDSFFREVFNSLPKEEINCFNSVFSKITDKMRQRREEQEEVNSCCK